MGSIVLDKWDEDDLITAESCNKRQVIKGTRNQVRALPTGNIERGSLVFLEDLEELVHSQDTSLNNYNLFEPEIGTIHMHGFGPASAVFNLDRWQLCNGQSLRRDEYSVLYNKIGETFGAVDSNTFKLPVMNFPRCIDIPADATRGTGGTTGGTEYHSLTIQEMPAHTHTGLKLTNPQSGSSIGTGLPLSSGVAQTQDIEFSNYTDSVGSGTLHENTPQYCAVLFSMRVK